MKKAKTFRIIAFLTQIDKNTQKLKFLNAKLTIKLVTTY